MRGAHPSRQHIARETSLLAQKLRPLITAAPSTTLQQRRQCAARALQRWQRFCSDHRQVLAAAAGASASTAKVAAEVAALPPQLLQRSDSLDHSSALSLNNIRQALIRQEDTIIFSLIERAQFAANDAIYRPGAIPVPGGGPEGRQARSLLEWLLRETEQTHGRIRRYTSPDEHAFYPGDVPELVLPPIEYAQVLAPYARDININDRIMALYLEHILPGISAQGQDNNFGSSAMYDVLALQALSKRIHYGKFVAEAKFRAQPEQYGALIRQRDAAGLMRLLTDEAVEAKVVERVRQKAAIYGQEIGEAPAAVNGGMQYAGADASSSQSHSSSSRENNAAMPAQGSSTTSSYKVEPERVAELYSEWVMPLTKEVQIQYLLRRLDDSQRWQSM